MAEVTTAEPPVTTTTDDTPPAAEPLVTPLAAIFDNALKSGMPDPAATTTPKTEAAPPPEAAPKKADDAPPPAEPAKKTEAAPEFELPKELIGDTTPPPAKETTVAELMPEEPPASIRTEKGKSDYKKWREHQMSLETKLKDFETKLKTQPSADANVLAENELLKQRLMEMSGAFERFAPELHPAFQQQFIQPKKEAIESAKALLKELTLEPSALDKALSATGQAQRDQLDELTESITSPSARGEFFDLVVKIKDLERKHAAAMSDIKGTNERLQLEERTRRHQQAQEQLKQINGMVETAFEGLRDQAGFELLKKIDGNEQWNAKVDGVIASAKRLLTETTDPLELAAFSVLGQLTPMYRTWALSESKRRLAAEKELAEERGAKPGLDGKGGGAGAGSETKERSPIEKIFDETLKTSGQPVFASLKSG